jgi:ribosome-associated translation inhibitor RaiA
MMPFRVHKQDPRVRIKVKYNNTTGEFQVDLHHVTAKLRATAWHSRKEVAMHRAFAQLNRMLQRKGRA